MATLDAAMEKEQKLRDDLLNLRWLYDTHRREDDSPTREYNLLQMLKLISRKEKQLESLLGVREAKKIQEEIFTEEIVIDSILESIFESVMDSFNSEEVTDCSQDSSISSEAPPDDSADELVIPSFLFDEEKVDSQITEIAKAEVNDVDRENHVQMKEVSYEHLEILRELITTHSELNCKDFFTLIFDFTRSLFDRGKKIKLSLGNSSFDEYYYEFGSKFDVYLKILDGYYRELVQELIHKHGYWSDLGCNGVSSTTWKMFGIFFEMDIVRLRSKHVIICQYPVINSFYSCFSFPGRVFDRGKGLFIGRYPCGVKNSYNFCLDLPNSCLIICDGSILPMIYYDEIFVSVPINKHGFRLDSLSIYFILLVLFKIGGYDDSGKMFVEMSQSGNLKLLDRWPGTLRDESLWVQLQYELLDAAILHLISLRGLSQSARSEAVHKFVSFTCLTIFFRGFFELHCWDFFHPVSFFYVHHGPWFGRFFRAYYASVRDISLQMNEVLSSACVSVFAWIVETQVLLMVIHILDILMLGDYLRWKFKLPTSGNYEILAIREEAKKVHLNFAKLVLKFLCYAQHDTYSRAWMWSFNVAESFYLYFYDTCSLIDRGKFVILFSFSYCKLHSQLIPSFGYPSNFLDIHSVHVCSHANEIRGVLELLDRWVYDRGKVVHAFQKSLYFVDAYKVGADTNTSCVTILIWLISLNRYHENLPYELIFSHGFLLDSLFLNSRRIVLLKNDDGDGFQLFMQMPELNYQVLLFLLDRVVETDKTLELLGRLLGSIVWIWNSGETDITSQPQNALRTVSACEHGQGNVLLLFGKEFECLLMLLSGPTIVRNVTSDVYETPSFRDTVIMAIAYYTWSCFYSFYSAQHLSSGCNLLMAIYKCVFTRYSQLCYNYMWRIACQPEKNFFYTDGVWPRTVGTKTSLMVVQVVKADLLSGNYLKWKFKLYSTVLWNVCHNTRLPFLKAALNYFLFGLITFKDTLYYTITYTFKADNSQCNRVLVAMFGLFRNFDGCAPRSILKVLSASTLLIVPTGEFKIDFEVCKGITGIFIGLAKFLEFSSSFVFDRGKSFSSHVWGLGYHSVKGSSWTEIMVRNGVIQDILVKIHIQFELEVEGQELMAFKRKQSTKRQDLCVPFLSYNTARDKGGGPEIMQADIALCSAAYHNFHISVHVCFGRKVDYRQLKVLCANKNKITVPVGTEVAVSIRQVPQGRTGTFQADYRNHCDKEEDLQSLSSALAGVRNLDGGTHRLLVIGCSLDSEQKFSMPAISYAPVLCIIPTGIL